MCCNAQLLDARQTIGFSAGYGKVKGEGNNLFFPSSASQLTFNVDLVYTHKILSWLSGGVDISHNDFSGISTQPSFTEVNSLNENLLSFGPIILVHTFYNRTGWLNAFQMGICILPNVNFYSGSRILTVNNEVISLTDGESIMPDIEMNDKSTSLGITLGPEINYRFTQHVGVKIGYSIHLLNINTGYGRENIMESAYEGGLVFFLSNSKQLF